MLGCRSPAQKEKKGRGRARKVKKLLLVADGNGRWEVKHKRQSKRGHKDGRKTGADDVAGGSASSAENIESAAGERSHCNVANGGILLDGDVQTRATKKIVRKKVRRIPSNTQVTNSLPNMEVHERIQPENCHISTLDSISVNNNDACVPTSPDADEVDSDVIIIDDDACVPARSGQDEEDPEVIIIEEVTSQAHGRDRCADSGSDVATSLTGPSRIPTENFVDMDFSRVHDPLEFPERILENYVRNPDTRCTEQRERPLWHQPQLPAEQCEQQPVQRSQTEVSHEMLNLSQGQCTHRKRVLQDVSGMNHIQLPRASPHFHESAPSNEYGWHQHQAFPERSQNRPLIYQCGSTHETSVDRPTITLDRPNLLRESRHVLCEEQVEKQTRTENDAQFVKTFHGIQSEGAERAPREAVFQERETPHHQHCQYPTARQEFSEEYQIQRSSSTVQTIFTNSISSQCYVAAQSVAVDSQVIYKEEIIIPQPQVEWNISDGRVRGDLNMDLNFSRGKLVGVNP